MTQHASDRDSNISAVKQQLKADLNRRQPETGKAQNLGGASDHIQRLAERHYLNELVFSSSIPVLGPVISRARQLWNSISTKWYVRHIVQQQVDFNLSAVASIQHLDQALEGLRQEIRYLEDLSVENDRYVTRLNTLMGSLSFYLQRLEAEHKSIEEGDHENRLRRAERSLSHLQAGAKSKNSDGPGGLIHPQTPKFDMDSLAFSQRFRGHVDRIKEQQRYYLEYFVNVDDVLDIGCGRGEFLDLLKEVGIRARGVDLDAEMVQYCLDRGQDAVHGDALAYLSSLPDNALGGVFSAQVIEHLPPAVLIDLVNLSYNKLVPGGVFLAETNNPMCFLAMSTHFAIDLTHERPIHPETIKFLMESAGFTEVTVRYTSPVPEELRLQMLKTMDEGQPGRSPAWVTTINGDLEKLNSMLFGYQDYAVIGRKEIR
ncbi:MAG: class I SAM-dependent methyltransferase [Dehalococcoidia bacterium]|nr:class I SAM-dependent methyltransferase [Dehalococcoidia bacterium]